MDDSADMQPQEGDGSISIPVTFDYKGGRGSSIKKRAIGIIVFVVIFLVAFIGTGINSDISTVQKVILMMIYLYIVQLIIRYPVLHEGYYSDIFEEQKANDYKLDTSDLWQIFDIESDYPYTCYFKNGKKGVFIRMIRDTMTGKSETEFSNHYDILADAYNAAHTMGMDLVHIDYMDVIGSDDRMKHVQDNLVNINNEKLAVDLSDLYKNLLYEMSNDYASYDVYLFTSRATQDIFIYNVLQVAQLMLGSNYISYQVLNEQEIANVCCALFNLNSFSTLAANNNTLKGELINGITPIRVIHEDGSVEKLNLTREEKRIKQAEEKRKAQEKSRAVQYEKERKKRIKKAKGKDVLKEEAEKTVVDLFDDDDDTKKS